MKDVAGFEGLYAVTDKGEVFSLPKTVAVGNRRGVRQQPLQKLKASHPSPRTSHLRVFLAKNGEKFPRMVHRLVAEAFIANPRNLPYVNHKDGDPTNNCVSNLEWCDARENALHAYRFGLHTPPNQQGANNSNSKLSEDDVRTIRMRHANGESCASIARSYTVNPRAINAIIHCQRWAHVT